jgi:hypothetical protein
MKLSTIILLLALIRKIQCEILSYSDADASHDAMVTATTNGIYTVCEHRDFVINIILPSSFKRNVELQHVLHEIVEEIAVRPVCLYHVKMVNELREGKHTMRLSVFLMDAGDYREVLAKISPKFFNFRMYFIIILLNATEELIQTILDDLWKKFIFNVNIVHCCEHNEAVITTFLPFQGDRCSDTAPVKLNKSSDFFPDKMRNLHKCTINVATSLDADPCVYGVRDPNGSVVPAGSDVHVIETLSEVLNFQIKYNFTRTQGYLEVNGSAEGPFRLLLESKADLAFDCYWLTNTRMTLLDSTSAYYNDVAVLVIPPGKDLSPFEKLLYPFGWSAWGALCGCIFFGLTLIFLLRFQMKRVSAVVYGEGNHSPAMNLLSVLLVGNQHIWPKNIFARLLLLNFLIFTLNLRTIYQGAMFELMQSSRKHDEMKSIDEVKANGFPLFVLKTSSEIFLHNEVVNGR